MPLALHIVRVFIYQSPDDSLSMMVAPIPDGRWFLTSAIDDPVDPEGDAIDAFVPLYFEDPDTALRVGSEYAIRHEGGTLEDVKTRTLDWRVEYEPLDIEFIPDPTDLLPLPIAMRGYVN